MVTLPERSARIFPGGRVVGASDTCEVISMHHQLERYANRFDRFYPAAVGLRRRAAPLQRIVSTVTTRPRRMVHAYCIGPPRAATTSAAGAVGQVLRTAHEPYPQEFVRNLVDHSRGRWDDGRLLEFLVARDARMRLDLEASHFLAPIAHHLPSLFPAARFVVLVRDAYTWLESQIDHELTLRRSRRNSYWFDLLDLYYRTGGHDHGPGEDVLASQGLAPLDGYLTFWAATYRRLIDALPPERTMLVRTDDLDASLPAITGFLGLRGIPGPRPCHLNARARRDFTLDRLDPSLVAEKVDRHCRDLMDRFFPELGSLEDRSTGDRRGSTA